MSQIILQGGPFHGISTNMGYGYRIGEEFGVGPHQTFDDREQRVWMHVYRKDSESSAVFVKSLRAISPPD